MPNAVQVLNIKRSHQIKRNRIINCADITKAFLVVIKEDNL